MTVSNYIRQMRWKLAQLVDKQAQRHETQDDRGIGKVVLDTSLPALAMQWLHRHELESGGIRACSRHQNSYPEVSGYLVPTLMQFGEREMAKRLTRWLLCIQCPDGSYPDPDHGVPHLFDTGQVLRGLLAAADTVDGAKIAAIKAADYLCSQMVDDGCLGFGDQYNGQVPETVMLYVLPPLNEASLKLGLPKYAQKAKACLKYYLGHEDLLKTATLTHFLAYEIEALIDLGHAEEVALLLDHLRGMQAPDGAVRAKDGVEWVCTPGLAQLSICWSKTGQWQAAEAALEWLHAEFRATGGLRGGIGKGATYFPDAEIPWAVKFTMDAYCQAMRARRRRQISDAVLQDSAIAELRKLVQRGGHVVDIGCRDGDVVARVCHDLQPASVTGIETSLEMMARLPDSALPVIGDIDNIPCTSDQFDVVYSVNGLDSALNYREMIAEMSRIAKPGGWIAVTGTLEDQGVQRKQQAWVSMPNHAQIEAAFREVCDQVDCRPLNGKGVVSMGASFIWRGRKRSRLTSEEWAPAILGTAESDELLQRVKFGHLTAWGEAILLATRAGDRILEIGSGTGEISLRLTKSGRNVTLLDYNSSLLEEARKRAAELGVAIATICADACQSFPFAPDEFDCVWSSGLLEHFSKSERVTMLREMARVSRRRVIALVPNASCLAYRLGKQEQERAGAWIYGYELPLSTLIPEFEEAGIVVVEERTVGAMHALSFLRCSDGRHDALGAVYNELGEARLNEMGQGYLLMTVGSVTAHDA